MNDNEPQVNDITNSKKNDNRELKMLTVIMTVLLIVLDQISKFLVVSRLGLYDKVTVIKGFFYIDHVRNTGSAFSFLADKSWGIYVLSGISVLMAAVILFALVKSLRDRKYSPITLSMMLLFAGAVGNLIDRFRLRYVVDFLRFDFGSYTFPIFNVADICAVVGTVLFIAMLIFRSKLFDAFLVSIGFQSIEEEKKEEKEVDNSASL